VRDILRRKASRQVGAPAREGAKQGQIRRPTGRREARSAMPRPARTPERRSQGDQMGSEAIAQGRRAARQILHRDKYIKHSASSPIHQKQEIHHAADEAYGDLGSFAGIGEIATASSAKV